MVDFTSVNPTSGGFKIGSNINQKMEIGTNHIAIGKGLLKTFVSNELSAEGHYAVTGYEGDVNISVTPQGDLFQVTIALTGKFSDHSKQFLATARQVTQHSVELDKQGGDLSMRLTQYNKTTFFAGRIDIDISWAPVTLYVMPA